MPPARAGRDGSISKSSCRKNPEASAGSRHMGVGDAGPRAVSAISKATKRDKRRRLRSGKRRQQAAGLGVKLPAREHVVAAGCSGRGESLFLNVLTEGYDGERSWHGAAQLRDYLRNVETTQREVDDDDPRLNLGSPFDECSHAGDDAQVGSRLACRARRLRSDHQVGGKEQAVHRCWPAGMKREITPRPVRARATRCRCSRRRAGQRSYRHRCCLLRRCGRRS